MSLFKAIGNKPLHDSCLFHEDRYVRLVILSLSKYMGGIAILTLFSCNSNTTPNETQNTLAPVTITKSDTITSDFVFVSEKDTVPHNGEYISYYKNGVMEMRGVMKNGKREGLWKSWYEDGSPWSETTFKNGVKNGKTTTWYDNEQKRYEGYYSDDKESGIWTFWDESGKQQQRKKF